KAGSDVRAVAVGAQHTCAFGLDVLPRCWGANGRGQLGNGSTTDSPAALVSLSILSARPSSFCGDRACSGGGENAGTCALDCCDATAGEDDDETTWGFANVMKPQIAFPGDAADGAAHAAARAQLKA